jgi:hypothetical protein
VCSLREPGIEEASLRDIQRIGHQRRHTNARPRRHGVLRIATTGSGVHARKLLRKGVKALSGPPVSDRRSDDNPPASPLRGVFQLDLACLEVATNPVGFGEVPGRSGLVAQLDATLDVFFR